MNLALPDTTTFREYDYKVGYQPESIYRPSIGYAQDNYGRGVYGGAGIVLTDLLGNNQMVLAGQVNGRLSEAFLLGAYTSLGSRLQYTLGVAQTPYFFVSRTTTSSRSATVRANFLETVRSRALHRASGVRDRHAPVEPVQPDRVRPVGEQRGTLDRGVQPRRRRRIRATDRSGSSTASSGSRA